MSKSKIRLFIKVISISFAVTCLFSAYFIYIKCKDYSGLQIDSFKWKVICLDNSMIYNYEPLSPIDSIKCNWNGYFSTSQNIVEWKVEYLSSASIDVILHKDLHYFKTNNYYLKKSSGVACSWESFNKTVYYASSVHGRDCITLALTKEGQYTIVRIYAIRG